MNDAVTPTPARNPLLRWQASGMHAAASLLLLGILWLVIARVWFPGFLYGTDGGDRVFHLVASAFLVLGPLLTLAVAGPDKPARMLRRDLAVIGVLQLSVLAGGGWLAWSSRPGAVFLVDGALYSQPVSAFADEPAARQRIREMGLGTPAWIDIALPDDPEQRGLYIDEAMRRKSSVVFDARLYTPFHHDAVDVRRAAQHNVEKKLSEKARSLLEGSGISAGDMAGGKWLIFPLHARYGLFVLAMDPGTGEIVRTLAEETDIQEKQ